MLNIGTGRNTAKGLPDRTGPKQVQFTALSADNQSFVSQKFHTYDKKRADGTEKRCCNGGSSHVHTLGQVGHLALGAGFSGRKKGADDLKKRAKNAHFSKELARYLTGLDSPLNRAYRRTLFDCCGMIMQEGQKLTAKYCDSRWCNTCNRIRTAKLINGYRQPLEGFENPHFVTLTVPNAIGSDLRLTIRQMVRTFANTVKAIRRAGNACNGIRKLECTYNAERDDFHPHFHVIVDGEETATALYDGWMQRNPLAHAKGQDIQPADNGSLMELFKYTTKIVTKVGCGEGFQIFVPALDTIFRAMYGVRTFQAFGTVRMVSENIENLQADTYDIEPYEFLVWQWEGNDWRSMATGKPLTGYKPSKRMMELLTERVIT